MKHESSDRKVHKDSKTAKVSQCGPHGHTAMMRLSGPRVHLGGKMCPAVQKASVSERIVATHKMTVRAIQKISSNSNLTSVCNMSRVYACI